MISWWFRNSCFVHFLAMTSVTPFWPIAFGYVPQSFTATGKNIKSISHFSTKIWGNTCGNITNICKCKILCNVFRKKKQERGTIAIIVLKVISIYTWGDTEHALEEKIFSLVACTTCCFALLQGLIRTYSLSVIANL